MANAEQIKPLIQSHFSDDPERFYTIALQVAAYEAVHGHGELASEIRDIVDKAGSEQTQARVLLKHDFILAALIASRSFESIIYKIISHSGIRLDDCGEDRDRLYRATKEIADRSELLDKLDVSTSDLHTWRKCRNDTVHPEMGQAPITISRAQGFVCGVQKLYNRLTNIK
jgi:hypothetical protein